jgi:ATP-binding cassette, subfamily B, bacterial MsbA
LIKKLRLGIHFIGPQVARLLFLLMVIGVLYFLAETGFAYFIQFFLVSLGIMNPSNLPWKSVHLDKSTVLYALIALGAFRAVCYFSKMYLSAVAQQYFIESQRKKIFAKSLTSPHLQFSLSEILANFSDIVSQAGFMIYYLSNFIVSTIATVFLFAYGFYLAPKEMCIGGLAIGVLGVPIKILNKKIHAHGRSVLKEWLETNNFLVTGIRNNFYLKLSGTLDSQIALGSRSLAKYRLHFNAFSRLQSMIASLPLFLGVIVIALVTHISLNYIHTSGAILLTFFYVFVRMSQMASESLNYAAQLKLNYQYVSKLYQLNSSFDDQPQTKLLESKNVLADGLSSIEINKVSFHYENAKPLFNDLNLKLTRNDVLVIRGESGAGKSTLLSILLGLKTPSTGDISFNATFNGLAPDLIGYIGPEPYLIPDTIRANLTFANSRKCSDDEIWKVLEKVKMVDVINKFPKKLDEKMSDDIPLSTGQKQRLAIARAFLRNAELYVLDEATANLDFETEEIVVSELKDRFKNSIAMIVTHKDSFDKLATQSLNLANIKSLD